MCASLINDKGHPPAWPWANEVLTDLVGEYAPLVAFVIGAVAGWMLASITGVLLILSANLTALALALAMIALVLGLVYVVIGSVAGWPPFDKHKAQINTPSPSEMTQRPTQGVTI